MFGFVSLGVSFASLVISCAALYWSRMARIEAAGAVERSRYALESSRKHVGLPYDHKIVHDWELRTQFGFAPQIKDDWTRRKDSDGVADSDDEDQPAIVLNTGKIPEYDGYALVCCIKSIPDEVQMAITDEGEVRDGYGY